jgi:hypothetical protein
MEPKLYVGNLSYETTEDELRQLFGEAGEVVSAAVITASMFNGRELRNRQLKVDLARPRDDRPGGGGGRDRRGGPGGGRGRGGPRY